MEQRQIQNPILPLGEYVPDGEPHVFGERVYLFGSHDGEGADRYCSMGDYVGWSAPVTDLTDWRCDGVLYRATQDPHARPGLDDLYAPDVVRGNDGRYYLYYVLSGPGGEGFDSQLSVAVCDSPAGAYEYLGIVRNADGTPFKEYIVSDPGLLNDDGTVRLYYGWSLSSGAAAAHRPGSPVVNARDVPREQLMQGMSFLFKRTREELERYPHPYMGANHVVLDDDMLTVRSEVARVVPGEFDAIDTSFEGHAFYEAASIRKIGATYYFIYSSQLSHELCYATSAYPDRDFVFGGTIISNGDVGLGGRLAADRLNMTANNHGSIEQINGAWYVFYHRQTHNSTFSRQACAEPITINADGSIDQVPCTTQGLHGAPLLVDREYPAAFACAITNGRMPHATNRVVGDDIPFITHEHDGATAGATTRFITNIADGTRVGYREFAFDGPTRLTLTTRGAAGRFVVSSDGGSDDVDDHRFGEVAVPASHEWVSTSVVIATGGPSALWLRFVAGGASAVDGRSDLLAISLRRAG